MEAPCLTSWVKPVYAANLMNTLEQQQSRDSSWASLGEKGSDSFESPKAQRRAHSNFQCPWEGCGQG